jgi:O-antigen/teichoic acid export membrane protein
VGEVVFPLISGMYLARVLGPEHLGQVAAVRNTVSYFLLLSALGIPRYALREAARCRENKQQLETFVSEILVLHLGAGLVALGAFWLLFCLEPVNWLHRIFGEPTFEDKNLSRMAQHLAALGFSFPGL